MSPYRLSSKRTFKRSGTVNRSQDAKGFFTFVYFVAVCIAIVFGLIVLTMHN